jgi:hypothetical protein
MPSPRFVVVDMGIFLSSITFVLSSARQPWLQLSFCHMEDESPLSLCSSLKIDRDSRVFYTVRWGLNHFNNQNIDLCHGIRVSEP